MSVSCGIIKDLLPLYHDGVCSTESKTLIEEHLKQCDSCKAELQVMNAALPMHNSEQNIRDANAIIKISKRWKREKVMSSIIGSLCTALLIAIVLFFLLFFNIKIG